MTGESLNFESKCKTPSRPNYVNLPTRLTSKRWFRAREETGRGIWLGAVPPLLTLKSMSLRARLPTPEQRVPDSRKRPVQAAWEGTRAPGFRTRGRAARRASAASASRCPWCPVWPAPSAPALQPARPPAAWLGSHRSPGPARQYLLESRKRAAERPGHAARPGQHRGGGGMEGGRPPDIGPGSSRK